MSAVFMVADNRIGFAPLSTANMKDARRFGPGSPVATHRVEPPFRMITGRISVRDHPDKPLKPRQTN
jgi:hypothetical protein